LAIETAKKENKSAITLEKLIKTLWI
jgi:hypothetical protein